MMRTLIQRCRPLLDLLAQLGPASHLLALRIVGRFGWKASLGGAIVLVYAGARYRTWIAWGVIAWCAAALAQKPHQGPTEEPVDDEHEAVEEAPAAPEPVDVQDVVRDAIGGARGVLLTALTGPLAAADTRAVRTLLTEAHIPIRPGVRTPGGNGPGVHRDDLPSPTRPPGDVVAAGQAANTNANNTPTVESREGMTIITDPADTHRRHDLRKP
ncbi:MAG: hypothetical protein LBV60_25810 [Streptomyces sp.]|jgi:hypothetical protein|nr:hypothetical protein [Streptomyces sp.]